MSTWKWTGPHVWCIPYNLWSTCCRKRRLSKESVVKLFRKSSVATQRLLDQCGVIVVNDCPTRWSSTFNMVTRLLTVKDAVCQITNDMGWDSLLTSEWQKLSSVHDLLLPFAEHTKGALTPVPFACSVLEEDSARFPPPHSPARPVITLLPKAVAWARLLLHTYVITS